MAFKTVQLMEKKQEEREKKVYTGKKKVLALYYLTINVGKNVCRENRG